MIFTRAAREPVSYNGRGLLQKLKKKKKSLDTPCLDAVKRTVSAFSENRIIDSQVVHSVAKSLYTAWTALTDPLVNVDNGREQMY